MFEIKRAKQKNYVFKSERDRRIILEKCFRPTLSTFRSLYSSVIKFVNKIVVVVIFKTVNSSLTLCFYYYNILVWTEFFRGTRFSKRLLRYYFKFCIILGNIFFLLLFLYRLLLPPETISTVSLLENFDQRIFITEFKVDLPHNWAHNLAKKWERSKSNWCNCIHMMVGVVSSCNLILRTCNWLKFWNAE